MRMDASDLIKKFSEMVVLPVDVNEVAQAILQNGNETDVEFIGVDLDPEILRGQIKVFHARDGVYGDPKRYANIYYHRGGGTDWHRLICCKELFHLLDPEGARTKDTKAIDELAEQIGLPPEMQNATAENFATNVDRLAEYRALAILLPLAAREILVEPYNAGAITGDDIARLADMPRRYVSFVMSEFWPRVHEILIS